MSVLSRLLGNRGGESESGLAVLQQYLRQQEQVLSLEVEYQQPDISGADDGSLEPVATFPMELYDDGAFRGTDALLFPIPDGGLQDGDAPLTRFLNAHGISTVDDLAAIEGQVDSAEVTDRGTVEVDY